MAMLVFGPSKTAKTQFVLSVRETSAIGFLANLFVSNEEINRIEAENSIKDTTEVTNTSLVSTDTATSSDNIEVIDIKGSSFKGKLMIIDDPSRLFVGTVESFHEGEGEVVASMAERYGAVAGINGGEFVDGVTTYTAMPVGLVMVNGEVLNGNEDETYRVTGISNDNKLVIGNMTMARAKELGIRDCVSVSNLIGPFLIVNGEMQDVSGTGGGLNPRTAIGQTADGKILLLVCDGRQITGMGASFADLQDIMAEYGAVNASVMDGGTSTQMYYNGEVINNPYSPTGPRTCPTAFLIK
jgi:exopolysaccharide biosynthesis protein